MLVLSLTGAGAPARASGTRRASRTNHEPTKCPIAAGVGDDGKSESRLVLEFQVNGGSAWAQATAFGVSSDAGASCELFDLTIANMDVAMMGTDPFQVALPAAKLPPDL